MANENVVTTSTSKQFSVNLRDIIKGLIVAVIGGVLGIIQESLSAGSFTFDWKKIGMFAATTAVAYIIKNFFTPSQTIIVPAPKSETQMVVAVPPPGESIKQVVEPNPAPNPPNVDAGKQ